MESIYYDLNFKAFNSVLEQLTSYQKIKKKLLHIETAVCQ